MQDHAERQEPAADPAGPDPCDAREEDDDPYVRRVVPAASEPPPVTRAPASVWDAAKVAAKAIRRDGRFGDAAGFATTRPIVAREAGCVRVVGVAYPRDRWTAEREEAERARRAKQKPPRPPKKARTRGKRVRQWDGEVFD